MRRVSWMLLGAVALCVAQTSQAATIKGRWLGQDKHDYCGEVGSTVAPNGVQDIHVALSGLPLGKKIVSIAINGHGADEWRYGDKKNQFAAVLLRKSNSSTGDLFFEPFHAETGREFGIKIRFDSGELVEFYVKGGKADPSIRMPDAAMSAKWLGQSRDDYTGLGPSVGPDGYEDAVIALAKLSKKERVKSIVLEGAGTRWAFGLNPQGLNNAELILSEKDATEGRLYFQPETDLAGQKLTLTLQYENGKGDTAVVTATRVQLADSGTLARTRRSRRRWTGRRPHPTLRHTDEQGRRGRGAQRLGPQDLGLSVEPSAQVRQRARISTPRVSPRRESNRGRHLLPALS